MGFAGVNWKRNVLKQRKKQDVLRKRRDVAKQKKRQREKGIVKVGGGDLRHYLSLDFCYFVVLMFCVA